MKLHLRFKHGFWWCRCAAENYGGHGRTAREAYDRAIYQGGLKGFFKKKESI